MSWYKSLPPGNKRGLKEDCRRGGCAEKKSSCAFHGAFSRSWCGYTGFFSVPWYRQFRVEIGPEKGRRPQHSRTAATLSQKDTNLTVTNHGPPREQDCRAARRNTGHGTMKKLKENGVKGRAKWYYGTVLYTYRRPELNRGSR